MGPKVRRALLCVALVTTVIFAATPQAAAAPSELIIPLGDPIEIAGAGADGVEGSRAIAGDGSQFLVVWRDAGADVRGTRILHDGTLVDTSPIDILTTTEESGYPAVVFDGTNFLVFYAHVPPGESAWDLYGARVTPGGTVLDTAGVRLTTGANLKPFRRLAATYDGSNALVAWRTEGASDIRAARVSPSLGNLDGATGFVVSNVDTSYYPASAFDGTNTLVVWHDSRSTPGYDIYGARITPSGTVLDPDGFLIAATDGNLQHAGVAFDGTNYLVAWMDARIGLDPDGGSVYGTRVSPGGSVLDAHPYIEISDDLSFLDPVVVEADEYGFLVAWASDLGTPPNFRGWDVFARRVDSDGSVPGTTAVPVAVGHWHQDQPVVGYDGGTFLVAYTVNRGVDDSIEAQRLVRGTVPGAVEPTQGTPTSSGWVWDPAGAPSVGFLTDIVGVGPTEFVAAGSKLARRSSGVWSTELTVASGSMYAATALPYGRVWTGGWCGAMVYSPYPGGSTWGPDSVWCYQVDGENNDLWGIFATSDEHVWQTGDRGVVVRRMPDWETTVSHTPGFATEYRDLIPGDFWDVWGTVADGMWAVGHGGRVGRFTGSSWSIIDVPTMQSLNAIDGSDPDDVWAVGDFGTIVHWNGSSWTAHDGGTTRHLFGVWAPSRSEAYAVGLGGTIVEWDGTSWAPAVSPTSGDLLGVGGYVDTASSTTTVFAVGDNDIVVTKTASLGGFTVAADDAYTTEEDVPLAVTAPSGVLANDLDPGDGLTAAEVLGADLGTVVVSGDGSFTYTPDPDVSGIDTFWYSVTDGTTTDLAEVVVTVTAVNDPPIANPDGPYEVEEDGRLEPDPSEDVTVNDTDIDGDDVTGEVVDTTSHGDLFFSDGHHFVYLPYGNYSGPDSFTYRAFDGELYSDPTTVTITVTPVNDAPTANPDGIWWLDEGGTINHGADNGVLGNDFDPDNDTLSAVFDTDVSHGTLTFYSDGGFSYTHDGSETVSDSFTYRAFDGELYSDPTTVTITVIPVNDAPTANPDGVWWLDEGGTINHVAANGILVNDFDPENDTLSAVFDTDVSHGTLTFYSDGGFSYTHDGSETDSDSFTYLASDGDLTSNLGIVTFGINPVNDAPVAAADGPYALAWSGTAHVVAPGVLGNDVDAEGDQLTAELVTNPVHGTVMFHADGSFSYSHDGTEAPLADSFTYRAGDGDKYSSPVSVSLTVTAPPDGDGDTVPDHRDNCPATSNPTQDDGDFDGIGDSCDPVHFADMDGHWAAVPVESVFEAGITKGCATDPLLFCPESVLTRAEITAFVLRATGEDSDLPPYQGTFPDVPDGEWYTAYIEKAAQIGYVNGYPDGTFGPANAVTRAEMAAVINRALSEPEPPAPSSDPFSDVPKSYWAAGYIDRLVELAVITGRPDGTYGPTDDLTRAEMGTVIDRAFLGN